MMEKLLNVHPEARINSQRELSQTPLLRQMDFEKILKKDTHPPFKPPADHLNCDPSLELEEMIVEAKPLHKKKKRLAKQRSAQKDSSENSTTESHFIKEFIVYNRYKELKRKAMELKEKEWQEELNTLMANSVVNNLCSIAEVSNEHQQQTIKTTVATASETNRNNGQLISITSTKNHIKNADSCETNRKNESDNIDFIDRTPSPISLSNEI